MLLGHSEEKIRLVKYSLADRRVPLSDARDTVYDHVRIRCNDYVDLPGIEHHSDLLVRLIRGHERTATLTGKDVIYLSDRFKSGICSGCVNFLSRAINFLLAHHLFVREGLAVKNDVDELAVC